ncbi:MFS transporter [Pseudooctadecabacter sp.]|uniref:MFS transporter n=1 Tax=Pseudooctadecabacter sp. TaxID=1966338 RepID=UPI0025E66811|nr:MFS transporter [Pseudooctadecabacter sp.]
MDRRDAKRGTLLIMALFALQPMAFGAWLAMIPYIKDTLSLSKADLALALLGMPLALIVVLQFASRIVARLGPRRTFTVGLPVQTLLILTPFLATGQISLFLALASVGAVVAFMEVALNTYAGRLEKAADTYIMSRCHGFWALGVMVGSLLATTLFFIGPVIAVLVICATSAGLGIWAAQTLPKLQGQEDGPAPKPQKIRDMPRALFLIALFMLLVTLVEGAMHDWAAVYLSERQGGAPEDAGLAVTIFAGFLAAGRFAGDFMKARLGARGVARLTVGLSIAGLVCATVLPGMPALFIGLALTGLGVSIAFPLGISAAASLGDEHEAQNIATMAMIAMSSFLIGPPLIGFLAEWLTLRVALMLLLPGLGLAFYLTRIFPERDLTPKS